MHLQHRARDPLAELNPAQRDAVTTASGPLLVLAGAGTGKTRVITFRMAELIRRGLPPECILSVTFTNKAAREMQERMQALVARRLKTRPVISTFHAYCVRVLRDEIAALGYPPRFTIYDRGDQEAAARKALRDLKVTDVTMSPSDLVNQVSRWKSAGVRAQHAADVAEDDREHLAALAYRKYQATLRASGAVDFDDLLLLTLQLFEEYPEALERQQRRFEHVQIDEYQDTNELQFRIVAELVRPHRNLCVVGDDDQSIYGWRGAEIKHILGFQQQFPGAKVVRLQDNYRCTREIITVANELVRYNRGRHEKTLVAHKSGTPVLFKPYPDEQGEAEGVVREVAYLINQLKTPPDHLAILFRTNEQPRLFESELRRLRVPYVLVGGQSFFDRREVRDLMAYLKVLAHPDDEVSLLRIINVPVRGIGEASVEKLIARAVRAGKTLFDIVPEAVAAKEITAKTASAIHKFREMLEGFRQRFAAPGTYLSETFQQLIGEIDYESEIQKQYKEVHMQLARSGVMEECIAAVREYERRSVKPSLAGFLEETALAGKEDNFGEDPEQQKSGVRLMTLHSAKGLEFPRVYLVGLEEGLLPHQRSVDADADSAIEEERRLAYVGVTRARDHLTVSWAQTRSKWGKRRETIPSRFLAEMQPDEPDSAPQ
jgi:DNA helicase-2/ATP-dependent DNA helicase PcrA